MKIAMLVLAIIFALLGLSELASLHEESLVKLGFPCLTIAAILFAGGGIIDAVDRTKRS